MQIEEVPQIELYRAVQDPEGRRSSPHRGLRAARRRPIRSGSKMQQKQRIVRAARRTSWPSASSMADTAISAIRRIGLLHMRRIHVLAAAFQGLHLGARSRTATAALHTGVTLREPRRPEASRSRFAPPRCRSIAERGVAAHWIYKQDGCVDRVRRNGTAWLQQPDRNPRQVRQNAEDFLEHTKLEMYPGPGVLLSRPRAS